ncbi:BTB/POZ domain-containing protein 6-like [Oratosquilla oratoria]|uniref:BTB/POZ domain-containing protein 6-like n=1 Tax=Oratosquilla oratoria TaxID=337810 RepID=UPI003F76F443
MEPILARLIPLMFLNAIAMGTSIDPVEIELEQSAAFEVNVKDLSTNNSDWTSWQTPLTSTHDRLAHLYSSGYFSDAILLLKDHNKEFKVHSLVLAMSSPVFEKMMFDQAEEGHKEFSLKGVSPKVLTKLLDHMYLDRVELESVSLALKVYSSAHFFHLDTLLTEAQQYVIAMMTEDDILNAYEVAVQYQDQEIIQKCIRMLNREGDAAFSTDSVVQIKLATFKSLLKHDVAVSSEVILLNSVIAWGEARMKDESSGNQILRKEIEDLLKEIRFLSMTCTEFIDNVINKNLFTDAEIVLLLKAIRGISLDSTLLDTIPTSHSKKRRRRNRKSMFELSFKCKTVKPTSFMLDQIYGDFLIKNLTVSEEIKLDSMTSSVEGIIGVQDEAGSTLASVTSEENTYTFPDSVLLKHGESYNIFYRPKGPKLMNQARKKNENTSVAYATFSFVPNFCTDLKMYFW